MQQKSKPCDPALRAVLEARMRLAVPAKKVFPLLCPVLEYDWIDGWDCDLVFTTSGVAELDCVFITHFPGEENEVWTVSRYEPPLAIEFVRVLAGKRVMRFAIALADDGQGGCELIWTKTQTGLYDGALAGLEQSGQTAHETLVRRLQRMLAHYFETGRMLPHAALEG